MDEWRTVLRNMTGWGEVLLVIFQEELAHNTKPEEESDMRAAIERLTDDLEMARELLKEAEQ